MTFAARKVPVSAKEKVKVELKRLQDLVIAPVGQLTKWVSQFVVAVKTSGDLGVCNDPKPLIDVLRRGRHQIPVTVYVLSDMPGRVCFKEVDLICSPAIGAGW